MNEIDLQLSSKGQARAQQILARAKAEARRRRRRRRGVRAACGLLVLMVAGLSGWHVLGQGAEERSQSQRPSRKAQAPGQPSDEPLRILRISTQVGLSERLSVRPDAGEIPRIGDAELLDTLEEAGQSAGLAYIAGRAYLLPRSQ